MDITQENLVKNETTGPASLVGPLCGGLWWFGPGHILLRQRHFPALGDKDLSRSTSVATPMAMKSTSMMMVFAVVAVALVIEASEVRWDLFGYRGELTKEMDIESAVEMGMKTWAQWIDDNVNSTKQLCFSGVFLRTQREALVLQCDTTHHG
ncbi:hypothetical protein LOK49_LG07G02056 [Camellia lanceoleosa]|uniref:Uncharacterized protein n=1 Tax=Camellia lanceoleosa TaxID=1840588 RepID=A0ACC0H6T9_9ERIC|nr:hypothetical protein LOK49_LG07G02056 [Camellia lanceoleosa]